MMVESEAMSLPVALYAHTLRFYQAMHEAAFVEEEDGADGAVLVVYEGSTTALWQELGYPAGDPRYSKVVSALQEMGSARQLQRGARNTLSRWLLLYEPTEAMFASYAQANPMFATYADRMRSYADRIDANVRAVNRRLIVVEGEIAALKRECAILRAGAESSALANHQEKEEGP